MTDRISKIVMIGAFPPPVHGMSAVNLAVLDRLIEEGESPFVIDIAASSLNRSLISRLKRIPRALRGIMQFTALPVPKGSTLYMSLSGSWGQVYELAFLSVARIRGMRIYLHHHNYTYIDQPTKLTRVLTYLAGSESTHIALSSVMAERIRAIYPCVKKAIVVSNAAFLLNESSGDGSARDRLRVLGFLSNISEEKGILEFLNLCEALQAHGISLSARLAGPFQDSQTEGEVRRRLKDLPMIEYIGPVYGTDKEEFLRSIDLLVFPTRYPNEAEPLVIHEAMKHGVPVIAFGRGAIPELVDDEVGVVIEPSATFVPAALTQVQIWSDDPQAFALRSNAALVRFEKLLHENTERWRVLRSELLAGEQGTVEYHARS